MTAAVAGSSGALVGTSGGYAATVLREMYGGSLPRAATQLLRDHAKIRSSSAPPTRSERVWSTGLADRKPTRRVDLRVPRVGQGKQESLARPPKLPTTGRKPLSHILLETSNYERELEIPFVHGRDCSEGEKRKLQNQYAYNFGTALPTTGVSDAAAAALAARQPRRRVSFECGSLPASREVSPRKSGLPPAQEKIAVEIVEGVRERQRELAGIDESLAGLVKRSEMPTESRQRTAVRKEMVAASKRRLELKNAIQSDMQDLDKLFDLAPADDQ